MGLWDSGTIICEICKLDHEESPFFTFDDFLDDNHKFAFLSGGAVHKKCFLNWEGKEEMLQEYKKYRRAVRPEISKSGSKGEELLQWLTDISNTQENK